MTLKTLMTAMVAGAVVLTGATPLGGCSGKRKASFELPAEDAQALERALQLTAAGDAAHRAGKHEEAIAKYREALSIRGNIGQTWNNFGLALYAQQKRAEAAQAFRRAADLMPSDPRPLENLGLLYMESDFFEEALKNYGESLGRDPNYLPSLRGAIKCAKLMNRSTTEGLERIRLGLMQETDPAWREIFRVERIRVEQDLAERAKVMPTDAVTR
jgi:tetratricopeptide (TPR) repeat protein